VFTATAVLSLAIGIGANAAVFSAASALLLRPMPGLSQPDRLIDIGRTQDGSGFDTVSYPYYRAVRERATSLEGVYALDVEPVAMSLGGRDGAERVYGTVVSGTYFEVLGVRPQSGRLLSREDDEGAPGSHAVAVISHDLWQRRFGGDPAIVGRTAPINGHPFAIVGIAPPEFHGTTVFRPDVWVPTSSIALVTRMHDDILQSRRAVWLMMGARLKRGVSVAQADAELRAIGATLQREYPREYQGKGLKALPVAAVPGMSGTIAQFLGLLMALVGLVLLIACVNVSGMLLARGAAREREIAVRMAIGARRSQIARQVLIETAVLFVLSGAAGVILSRWFAALLLGVLPELPFPISLDLVTDWRVFAFATGISFAGALLAGLMPAVQASRRISSPC
jgi:predicted permease